MGNQFKVIHAKIGVTSENIIVARNLLVLRWRVVVLKKLQLYTEGDEYNMGNGC